MICAIFVAGHGALLEDELKRDLSGHYGHLVGTPKALLPIVDGTKSALDMWWEAVNAKKEFREVFLITNADKYKYYERWATASGFPIENLINDGTTSHATRIGSVADLRLLLNSKDVDEDILVVAGDMAFFPNSFDISSITSFFKAKDGDLAVHYQLAPEELTENRGIVEVNSETGRIVKFLEKPKKSETTSRSASVVLYVIRQSSLHFVDEFLDLCPNVSDRVFGRFLAYLVERVPVYGMKLPTRFQLIGNVGLKEYEACIAECAIAKVRKSQHHSLVRRAYARVGLMGNPSDGFHGKTISLSIQNFWAEVTIYESERLRLMPHPLNDPNVFGSLADLYGISRKEGYQGGLRLMQATCKKFFEYCTQRGIAFSKVNFTLAYDTNIPRQVGLAGSSAIVSATLRCLTDFYNLSDDDIPLVYRPNLVLSVEEELGITAGLQDRVIQAYEGCVFMDFNKKYMDEHNCGLYEPIPIQRLESFQFYLAYLADPSDSGKIHSDVKERWRRGDSFVTSKMEEFAQLTVRARDAFLQCDVAAIADMMDENFAIRKAVYGDACLGEANLRMVALAQKYKAAVKFPGSGGAVLIMPRQETNVPEMRRAFEKMGCVFVSLVPNPPSHK